MWTRAELKEKAKASFKANYWLCVAVSLILSFCVGGSGGAAGRSASNNTSDAQNLVESMEPQQLLAIVGIVIGVVAVVLCVGLVISIFVTNPLSVGCYRFFVINRNEKARFGEVGAGFKYNYMNNVKIMFLKQLFISLWSLLFVIPGIIKSYEYMMVPYLIAENPELSSKEAFAISKQMMTGEKWNAFVLDLSFIGWYLLTGLTLGILGVFYTMPYIYSTKAELYYALKEK